MSLVRRLPAIPRTGDQSTRAWVQAAHEIIERLQQGNGTTTQVIVSSSGSSGSVTKESIGLGSVDNTSDADKPISNDTRIALDQIQTGIKSLGVDVWDVSTETIEVIGAEAADWFLITGAGTFRGKSLVVGDAVLFYTDSLGDLDVIVISDVSDKEDKINKSENLLSPDHVKYPTTQAVTTALAALYLPVDVSADLTFGVTVSAVFDCSRLGDTVTFCGVIENLDPAIITAGTVIGSVDTALIPSVSFLADGLQSAVAVMDNGDIQAARDIPIAGKIAGSLVWLVA